MLVDLNLNKKKVLVIGGGTEGGRKVHGLLGQNCEVTVISSRMNHYLSNLEAKGKIAYVKQKISDPNMLNDYVNPFLVMACTDDRDLNRNIVGKARSMGAFVYAVDDPEVSDFSYAAIINIEDVLQIAISSSGRSPIMARNIRIKAERILRRVIKKTDIEMARLQEFARNAAKPKIKTVKHRKEFLYTVFHDENIRSLIKEDRLEDARVAALSLLNTWSDLR